jgi:cyclopropane-fatty-acyl-phospholipid synthase
VTVSAALGRRVVFAALARLRHGRLTVVDTDGRVLVFGPGAADSIQARVTVHDERAWKALAFEGSVGLGRGYLERWWESDDPVAVVRLAIQNVEGLDRWRNKVQWASLGAGDLVRRARPRRDAPRNREEIASHYDLGNEFFASFLDDTLTYSSAIFPTPDTPLAEASLHKYDVILAKLGVNRDHHVLEIGTGWGGFALRAAQTTGCRVTTTTVSAEQFRLARERVKAAGLTASVTVLDQDWRHLTGTFDRVASIEMIEAVDWRDYDAFFRMIEGRLRPDGLAALQAICLPDRRYERAKNTEDFIRHFVFPGGFLPSLGAITRSTARATGLLVVGVDDYTAHYVETLRRWRARFEENEMAVAALGLDERFRRLWRFYLAYREAGFRERHVSVHQMVLAGRRWRGTLPCAAAASAGGGEG